MTVAAPPTVRLSAAVMTHPSRLARVDAFRARHPEIAWHVAVDPEPDGPPSALRSARLAWAAADESATHHLVVQDDVILGPDPLPAIRAAIGWRPDDAISLFTEWGSATSFSVRLGALVGADFAEVTDHYAPTVGAVLPTAVARAFAAAPATVPQDDVALRTFLLREGIGSYIPVRNLADHDPGTSLTGNDFMGARKAACFLPSAPLSGSVVRPDVLPFLSWTEGRALCNVREDAAGASWRRELPAWFFAHYGIDVAAVTAAGSVAVRPHAGGPIPLVLLFGVWVTACELGVAAARLPSILELLPRQNGHMPRRSGYNSKIDGGVASEALRTMPWGALRQYCTADTLTVAGPLLMDLMTDGVRHGLEIGGTP